MIKAYNTQDYLRIQLSFDADIATSIANQVIKYKDPSGTEGSWIASLDVDNKLIYYDVPSGGELSIAGTWTVWSFVTMNDGRVLPGTPTKFNICVEGT